MKTIIKYKDKVGYIDSYMASPMNGIYIIVILPNIPIISIIYDKSELEVLPIEEQKRYNDMFFG